MREVNQIIARINKGRPHDPLGLPPNYTSLDILRAVYQNPRLEISMRMRAAIAALHRSWAFMYSSTARTWRSDSTQPSNARAWRGWASVRVTKWARRRLSRRRTREPTRPREGARHDDLLPLRAATASISSSTPKLRP